MSNNILILEEADKERGKISFLGENIPDNEYITKLKNLFSLRDRIKEIVMGSEPEEQKKTELLKKIDEDSQRIKVALMNSVNRS
jgi:hypothetical protein